MSKGKKLVPRRRFKEFREAGDWERRKFGDLVSRKGSISNEPAFPRVEYEDIVSGSGELNKNLSNKLSQKAGLEFSTGDILFGKLRPYLKNWLFADFNGIAVGDFWVLKPTDTDGKFIYYLIQTPGFQEVANQSTGTKMPRSDWSIVSKSEYVVPKNILEQEQIGTLFCNFDNLITLHQRKLEKMKALKAACLSEMFPAEGERKPKRRFKGFTGDWEQRRLGEIGETYTGLTGKTKEDFGHGEAKYITYMNVFSNAVADKSMIEPIEIDAKQNKVQVGDVFFTTSSETPEEVGMSSVLLENSENTYLNSFCFGYRPTIKIEGYYLAYMLRSEAVRKSVIFLAQGISRYNISKNKVMQIVIPLPEFDEQMRIGSFFKDLDYLITLHRRTLEKLQNLKAAYLNEMFAGGVKHHEQ